jgi:hypothetical protein
MRSPIQGHLLMHVIKSHDTRNGEEGNILSL